ncbi:hypothetical protein [Mesorhizobium sp. M0435]|uniref:hypothetical protein n=1 Tax=Mesorhizobium sp. M0435 TaxID=2956944 RepID=UPI00333CCE99
MAKLQITAGIASITVGILAAAAPASARAFCDAKVASYRGELEAKAGPALIEIDDGIAEIRTGGGDPDKLGFKMADGTFKTLPELRALLLTQKAAASQEIDAASADCTSALKPYQDAVDAGMTIATGGLNKILPERMTHIEIGEILAGKPLGGEGALIPHFREQLLGALGLQHDRGFVTKFIRDPIHAIFPHW